MHGQFLEVTRDSGEFVWLAIAEEVTAHIWVFDCDTNAFHIKRGLIFDYLVMTELCYRPIDHAEAVTIAATMPRGLPKLLREIHAADAEAVPAAEVLAAPHPFPRPISGDHLRMFTTPTDADRSRRADDLRSRAQQVRAHGWAEFESVWSSGEVLGVRAALREPGAVDAAVSVWAFTLFGLDGGAVDEQNGYVRTRAWFADL